MTATVSADLFSPDKRRERVVDWQAPGPAAAGALIKLTGAPLALLATAGLLFTSASILRGVPVKETPSKARTPFWPALHLPPPLLRSLLPSLPPRRRWW